MTSSTEADREKNLDEKLQELLDQFTVKPLPEDKYYRRGQYEIIAQIKQVFAEEGYRLHLAENVVTITSKDAGQEFYKRFLENAESIDLNSKTRWDEIKEAARKAAGVDK